MHADSYTIDQFLDQVLKHGKDLKLAAEDLKFAQATKKEAVSGALPSVKASAGYDRNLASNYMYVDLGEEPTRLKINRNNEFRANIKLDQTLFSGAIYNAIKAANEYQQVTEYMYQASQAEIVTIARKAFYQALLLRKVLEVSQQSQKNALDNYENIKLGYENGLKSEFEKLQAEVRYRELIPQTSEAGRNFDIAIMNLKNIAGIDAGAEFVPDGSLDNYPSVPADLSFESILAQRPDYNAIVWEEKLRTTGVRAEKTGRMPTLTGFFSYDYSAQSDQFALDEENNSYTVGLNLSLPIFTGGATSAKIQKATIELNRVKINRDRAVDNIRTNTMNIRLRLNEAFSRIDHGQSAVISARKAFEIAQATSKAGLTTQLELKDSRLMLDQTEVAYYSAIYEYLDAYFDWEKATGRAGQSD